MIPEATVEAAEEYLSLLMADPNGDYTMEARTLLEAAAPHMLAGAWEEGASAQARCYGMEKDTGPNPYMLNNEGEK